MLTNLARVSYGDQLEHGNKLMAIEVEGAEAYLNFGKVYHFSRWGNSSTVLLKEIESNIIGRTGFRPSRFVKVG